MRQTSMQIDQIWPVTELEQVTLCPYCASVDQDLAYEGTQDWTFESAPGRWAYWRCLQCSALYLNPRPNVRSIGRAYAHYYTHDDDALSFLARFKECVVNEFLSHRYGLNLEPRWSLPRCFSWVLNPIRHKLVMPFGFESLQSLSKGRLMDVGCGSGKFLQIGQQLGWDCFGLELDPEAVKTARQLGLNVEEGSYEKLADYSAYFDCIVCSHVLEHVYQPIDLLQRLYGALRPGGTLLLSAPNSMSDASSFFGPYWRGLEAPRHLAIPAAPFLRDYLRGIGFRVSQRVFQTFPTIAESITIQKKVMPQGGLSAQSVKQVRALLGRPTEDLVDFIELICVKPLASHDNEHGSA